MKALTSLKSEWVFIEWNFLLQCWLDSLAEAPETRSPQNLSATLLCSLCVLHSWICKTSAAEKSSYADFGMVDLTFIQSHSGPFMLKVEPLGKWPFSVFFSQHAWLWRKDSKYLFILRYKKKKAPSLQTCYTQKRLSEISATSAEKLKLKIWCVGKHGVLIWSLT